MLFEPLPEPGPEPKPEPAALEPTRSPNGRRPDLTVVAPLAAGEVAPEEPPT